MSRLIDADDFKKFLQVLCKAGAPYEGVVELLDKQPTAFDTEKVVEQLEEKRAKFQKEMEDCIFKGLPYHDSLEGQIVGIIEAIDIVKKGGVK